MHADLLFLLAKVAEDHVLAVLLPSEMAHKQDCCLLSAQALQAWRLHTLALQTAADTVL